MRLTDDCYRKAYDLMTELRVGGERVLLCHGKIANPDGILGHAWVEMHAGQSCVDPTRGNGPYDAAAYYRMRVVVWVKKYRPDAARQEVERIGHYGPWDEPRF